jgi:hypothetical protein
MIISFFTYFFLSWSLVVSKGRFIGVIGKWIKFGLRILTTQSSSIFLIKTFHGVLRISEMSKN